MLYLSQLNKTSGTDVVNVEDSLQDQYAHISVTGIHTRNRRFYEKTDDNIFKCIHSMEVISFDKINDDYCDCLDGTDEPGTNACSNGEFYCKQESLTRKSPIKIPSNRVNDGICDCCDGSDEWQNKTKHDLEGKDYVRFEISE
ncbi:n-linked oligosaccharide processing [Holotrichia oblita]|uniref:N-linked oligosaccharide processing n=1 Tax=Holotrichia oblita TaxID=644536 RepID=A0ACB9SVE6_HOLOL|nr:n-linked oligosaccharide processing [Holotrichia oblita]